MKDFAKHYLGTLAAYYVSTQINIERPPPAPFEVRMVVWRAKDVPSGDGVSKETTAT